MSETTNLTLDEQEALSKARSEQEWNTLCDQVKRARGGMYPADWYQKVILSGLAGRVSKSWEVAHA